jgi:hypothetical protein
VNVTNILSKEVNDIQQYQRRDSCEITGMPVLPVENNSELVKKVGLLMDL